MERTQSSTNLGELNRTKEATLQTTDEVVQSGVHQARKRHASNCRQDSLSILPKPPAGLSSNRGRLTCIAFQLPRLAQKRDCQPQGSTERYHFDCWLMSCETAHT